jgi:exopolysaccharide production protein ExoY
MTTNAFDKGPIRRRPHYFLKLRFQKAPGLRFAASADRSLQSVSAYPAGKQAGAPGFDQGRPVAADLNGRDTPTPLGGWPKRLTDVAVAVAALLLASPLMLIITVFIRITAGGPAFFPHHRIGFNGRPFVCYKFRTMVANSEQVLREHLARDSEAAEEWARCRKLKHDPRVTLWGHILRRSSLDELPQLFNILRGDMSCVGPRPIVPDELQLYGACAQDYLRARPGLTGAWQVSGRSNTDYANRVALDSHYVRNWSLWTDFAILLRTTVAVMRFDEAS